jgi:hypothetical protein
MFTEITIACGNLKVASDSKSAPVAHRRVESTGASLINRPSVGCANGVGTTRPHGQAERNVRALWAERAGTW